MARYYFHLRDGVDLLLDPEGRDLPGPEAISAAALKDARSILGEEVRLGKLKLDQRIDVEDDVGVMVYRLLFADAVEIVPAGASTADWSPEGRPPRASAR